MVVLDEKYGKLGLSKRGKMLPLPPLLENSEHTYQGGVAATGYGRGAGGGGGALWDDESSDGSLSSLAGDHHSIGTNPLTDGGGDAISVVTMEMDDTKAPPLDGGKKRRPRRERKRSSVVAKVRNAVKGGGTDKHMNAVPIHEYVALTEMDIEALLETLQRKGPKDLTTDMSAR